MNKDIFVYYTNGSEFVSSGKNALFWYYGNNTIIIGIIVRILEGKYYGVADIPMVNDLTKCLLSEYIKSLNVETFNKVEPKLWTVFEDNL